MSKGVVPKLRFPEFEKEGWIDAVFGSMGSLMRGVTYSSDEVSADGLLVLRSSNIQNESLVLNKDLVFISPRSLSNLELKVGDVVICMSNGSRALVGKNAEYLGNYPDPITVGAFCSIFRPKNKFGKYLLRTENYEKFVSVSIGGGNINNLKNSQLEKLQVQIPNTPAEQQKIADCLSSLDDLITAQTQKLDLLKDHKKGLMQDLFPAEGETVPRVRFKGFEGEWIERNLGEVGDFIGGGTPDTSTPEYWNGDIPWYTPSEIKHGQLKDSERKLTQEGVKKSSAKMLPPGSILITTRATIGEVAIAISPCTTNQGFQSLVVKSSESNLFWYYWILNNKYELTRRSSGSTFMEIGRAEILRIPTISPRFEEQQKIADCLSSLDDQIQAQTQKIEALKLHKKGLMQQLFPTYTS